MAILYFDCFSGASGDMILGALIDAGVSLDEVRRALGSLAIDHDAVWTHRVNRSGVTATKFCVRGEDAARDHAHDHGPGHEHDDPLAPNVPVSGEQHEHGSSGSHQHASAHSHPAHVHRTLGEIETLIDGSALSASGKIRAKELFGRLGEAEAAIHGISIDAVHLHEVGALDSIIDIVGTVFALESLDVRHVVSSPLNVGSGTVRSAHGLYPVPAPATLRLLQGAPIYSGPQQCELVTPTGALIVSSYAASYGPVPPMRLRATGYGAGSRNLHDTPNVLRVLVGDADAAAPSQSIIVIEAEIDDMNPQIFGMLMDRLLSEKALDVFYTPIQMKKNRPGTLLTVLAAPDARERLASTIFRETTTIGVRYREMVRECLDRETVSVETPIGPVRFKIARRYGELMNASPEFDDCVRLAAETGRPVKDIQAAATKAFLDRNS